MLTPRQRVIAAFNHQKPDRVPIELGTTRASGISVSAYQNLCAYLGKPIENETVVRFSQVTIPAEEILQKFGVDCRPIFTGAPCHTKDVELPGGVWQDEWGVKRIKPEGSHYYDLYESPLSDAALTLADINKHSWPDPDDPGRVQGISDTYKRLRENTQYAVLLHLGAEIGLQTQYLRGFEEWFIDLASRPELANALMDRVLEFQIRHTENVLASLPGDVDIIYLVDDFATQNGLMISPKTYRNFIKPRQKKLIEIIKMQSDAKIMLHLCGSIVAILDDLVEIGVDAINPVQLSARNMDAESLKSRFGNKLTFWGAVDGQSLLPNGSPQDIAAEVQRLIKVLGEDGGFVIGPCHNIQPDVPPQNIVAMYEAALTQ